jgi:hypothetical protein
MFRHVGCTQRESSGIGLIRFGERLRPRKGVAAVGYAIINSRGPSATTTELTPEPRLLISPGAITIRDERRNNAGSNYYGQGTIGQSAAHEE